MFGASKKKIQKRSKEEDTITSPQKYKTILNVQNSTIKMEVKVVIFGGYDAGKSNLMLQYISHLFVEEFQPTIEDGRSGYKKQIEIEGDPIVVSIMLFGDNFGDTFQILADQYIKSGEVFIIAYSITNRKSFEEVNKFREKIIQVKESDNVSVILVGTKIDLENERKVSTQEGQDLANLYGMSFFETSAKTRINIDKVFYEAAKLYMYEKLPFRISNLEKKMKNLNKLQIFEKKKIEKQLKRLYCEQEYYNTIKKKAKLEKELKLLPLPSPPTFKIKDSSFIQDFKNLINQKESSDQIIEIESIPYYVHKLILKIRCPELSSLLENERNISLPNISYSTFNSFVEYIYTGSISKENNLDGLIQLSKRFRLDLLSKLCLEPDNINLQIESKEQFKSDIKFLYNNPSHCDITFKTFSSKDNEKEEIFKVHKLVLIARSSWFRSFLSNQWKESTEEIIIMKERNSESFTGLIEYLYNDILSIEKYNPDALIQLIKISDEFNLVRLKEICESLLSQFLDIETILPLYEHCILHGANQLKEKCIYFMSQPESFDFLKEQEQFKLIEPSIQTKIQKDNESIVNLIEKRNSLLKSIQECDQTLQRLKASSS